MDVCVCECVCLCVYEAALFFFHKGQQANEVSRPEREREREMDLSTL